MDQEANEPFVAKNTFHLKSEPKEELVNKNKKIDIKQKVEKQKGIEENGNPKKKKENFKWRSQLDDILNILYQNETEHPGNLKLCTKRQYILNQWKITAQNNVEIDEDDEHCVFFGLVKWAVLAANSQSGCERGNSIYNLFKNELSSSMQLPMIMAGLRTFITSPSLSKFNLIPVRQLWLQKGHQLAATITGKKKFNKNKTNTLQIFMINCFNLNNVLNLILTLSTSRKLLINH